MATFLLDTSVLVDVLRGKRGRKDYLAALVTQGHMLACCAVSVAELYFGMHPREARPTRVLLGSLIHYDITRDLAQQAGRLRYDWARKGTTLTLSDTLIAAVALTHGLSLMTDNRKDFPMPELTLCDLP